LLYIGSSSLKGASLPDQIKFVKEKSGFMYVFTTKSYVAATKVSQFLSESLNGTSNLPSNFFPQCGKIE
jgi:hypothetical protein